MRRRFFMKTLAASIALAGIGIQASGPVHAADTIKVGILHSLSGTMAISETVLKDQRQGRRAGQEAGARGG